MVALARLSSAEEPPFAMKIALREGRLSHLRHACNRAGAGSCYGAPNR
jgi:hypothetical protein